MGLTIITSTSFFFFFFCFSFTYPFGYRACIQHRKRERHRTHTTHTERDTVSPRPEDVKEDIEFLCVSGVCGTSGAGFNQHISFIYGPTNQDCVSLPHTHKPKYIYPRNGFVRSFVRNKVGKVFPPNSIPVCTPSLFDKVPFNGRQRTN